MVDSELEAADLKETANRSLLENLAACAFYFLLSFAIFFLPFYAGLPRIASIPFFVFGGLFIYVSIVTLLIRLAEHAAGLSDWDKNGLITVTSLWSWGLLLVLGSAYFGIHNRWKVAFYVPGILILLIGLAGSIYELAKRETKGAGWYWIPGLVWLAAALILHAVKVIVNMPSVLEMIVGTGVVFCLIGGVSFLLPMIPYQFPTPKPRSKYWKTTLRCVSRKTQQQHEQTTSKLTKTEVSVVAYRLLIIFSLLSLVLILLTFG